MDIDRERLDYLKAMMPKMNQRYSGSKWYVCTEDGREFLTDSLESAEALRVELADGMAEGLGKDEWCLAHESIDIIPCNGVS